MEKIILVDESDNMTGEGEKMEVHRKGLLHRCFSIFIFNSSGEMMLQQRAKHKYHSGGLWTNACCSHPRPGEQNIDAAHRRLKEEMGFDCDLREVMTFTYRAQLDHGMTEHEYDHVFIGIYDGEPLLNPEEADGWKLASISSIIDDLKCNPGSYTAWFSIAMEIILKNKALFGMDDTARGA